MKLSSGSKIAICWSVIISVGLYSFVLARNSVTQNRKAIMDTKRRIRELAQREGDAQFENKNTLPVQSSDTIKS